MPAFTFRRLPSARFHRPLRQLAIVLAVSVGFIPLRSAAAPLQWIDHGPTFRAGTPGNSGQNLYVNHRGELETIRRFDVDNDGNVDLLTNSGHDMFYALPATLAQTGPEGTLTVDELAVDGSSRVVTCDFNRDGFTDLAFLPNVSNIQYAHRSSLKIAWGGSDGWSNARLTRQLPVDGGFGAEDSWLPTARLAAGDLNGDGWPDLLTLNGEGWLFGQPSGRIIRTFWGGPDGFQLTHFHDLGVADAAEIATGGFGSQRQFPAVVLTTSGQLHYLAADGQGGLRVARTIQLPLPAGGQPVKLQCLVAQPGEIGQGDTLWIGTDTNLLLHVGPAAEVTGVQAIEAQPATSLAVGRLDDDAFPDLVLTDLKLVVRSKLTREGHVGSVTVLWGMAGGLDTARTATLAIPNAIATTIGDLNADGHGDLVVSVHQGDTTMKADSLIYLGDGTRHLPDNAQPVPTEGAQGAVIARVTPTAAPVAVFANSMSFTLDSAVPAVLYWGTGHGFSTDARVEIPNLGGLKSSLSDLNADGHPDLIIINGGDVTAEAIARGSSIGANIYWGGSEGAIRGPGPTRFDASRRQILREPHLCSINVADLNNDGFLDIVLGAYESAKPDTDMAIYYGSAEGYLPANRKTVHVPSRSFGLVIADFNRDRRLDIAIIGYANDLVTTYWGDADGYSDDHKSLLRYPAPIELESADLNGDGWLDLIVCSYYDPVTHNRDTGLSIFWGGPQGWKQSGSQWLPGLSPQATAVADLDGDGFPDLVVPNYHGELTREHLPSYIYWGSARGFATGNRTLLDADSSTDVMVADFDRDGRLDLAFTAHSVNAGHRVECPVYFNDGHRFQFPRVERLPAIGPFYGWEQDPGNIYTRSYDEDFTSRVFLWTDARERGRITVDATAPFESSVIVRVRTAASEDSLAAAPWQTAAGGAFAVAAGDRVLQYRLDLRSANGSAYPLVRQVVVSLE